MPPRHGDTNVPDPVGSGYVRSLSRPAGNATGFMKFEYSLCSKWPALLKEIAPHTTRAAVLRDPVLSGIGQFAVIQSVAGSVGVEVIPINLSDTAGLERELADFAQSVDGGLILTASTFSAIHRNLNHHACSPPQTARGISGAHLCCCWWIDLLRAKFPRPVPASRGIRRSHPQRRQASRPAGAGSSEVRARDQSQDRKGAWDRGTTVAARPRR
jgi:hypothetical protein